DATITINPAPSILPATAVVTQGGQIALTGQDGVPPYTFLINGTGPGTIDPASGVYTADNAPGLVTIRMRDSLGNSAYRQVTINPSIVVSPSPAIVAQGTTLALSATGGVPPYTYLISGTGLGSIDPSSGVFTPPDAPTLTTIRVRDTLGNSGYLQVRTNPPL